MQWTLKYSHEFYILRIKFLDNHFGKHKLSWHYSQFTEKVSGLSTSSVLIRFCTNDSLLANEVNRQSHHLDHITFSEIDLLYVYYNDVSYCHLPSENIIDSKFQIRIVICYYFSWVFNLKMFLCCYQLCWFISPFWHSNH